MNADFVVYTAVTGGYDALCQPDKVYPGVEYYCFSNEIHQSRVGVWQIRPIPFVSTDRVRIPRYVKMHPEQFFPNHEASLWLDANITPAYAILEKAVALVESGVLFSTHPHPVRHSVYEEALILLECGKGKSWEVLRQLKFLLSEPFPDTVGLKETCVLFRRHNHPKVKEFDALWWSLLSRYSTRDQLGCDYCLWKTGLPFVPFSDWKSISQFQHRHCPVRNRMTIRRVASWAIRMVHLRIARCLVRRFWKLRNGKDSLH